MASKATLKKMKEMFNGDLPIVKAKVKTGIIKTPKTDGSFYTDYVFNEIDVEVLTVNFNTGGMRIRYIANIWGNGDSIESCDISNESFMKIIKIEGK